MRSSLLGQMIADSRLLLQVIESARRLALAAETSAMDTAVGLALGVSAALRE